jgi:flagellar motility protein MotE (MotC chaperone)
MIRAKSAVILTSLALLLPGCAAKTAFDIATTPVRTTRDAVNAASRTYDVLTTSQSEADEKRGRDLRHREERLAKLQKRYRDQTEDCRDGNDDACDDRGETWSEMQALYPTIPVQRR